MKNGSSRGPANTCMPVGAPSTVLRAPVTAGVTSATSFSIAPWTGGASGPRTSTFWFAPSPVKRHLDDLVLLRVAVGVDLELVEQVGVERRLGRIGGLRRGEECAGVHRQHGAPAGAREGVDVGQVGLGVELDKRGVLVVGARSRTSPRRRRRRVRRVRRRARDGARSVSLAWACFSLGPLEVTRGTEAPVLVTSIRAPHPIGCIRVGMHPGPPRRA